MEGLPAWAGLDYQTAEEVSLDDALAELAGMECPEGVEGKLWAELKDALGEALFCRARTCGAPLGDNAKMLDGGAQVPALQDGTRIVCSPPTGEANRVTDLTITDNGDGTFALNWRYKNLGDYDQNGTVAIDDITPIAQHFGETYDTEDENCLLAVIDGSGNGRVGIEEITPIAMNFAVEVEHYAIEGAPNEAGSYELVSEVTRDTGKGDGRLEYSAIIESPAALWHRVMPYDSEGNPGEASNAVLRPSNEPVIYDVSPTEGYQHEDCTFTATVSGVEPLTYAWDFGGGATPDVTAEPSPTVTLTDAGEYAASLTVTNAYGEATFPFTLTVSERDSWAHTWGGEGHEAAEDLAVDEEGNICVLGYTESFGAGDQDSLVLKYSPEGQLLWARTWGGQYFEYPRGIAVLSDGDIIVGGYTMSFGAGADDIFILKYDPEGNLLMQKTWGTADYERVEDMAIDEENNIYFAGYWTTFGGGNRDGLVVKLTNDGDSVWAWRWHIGSEDKATALAIGQAGNLYCAGRTGKSTDMEADLVLMRCDAQGNLVWSMKGDSGFNDGIGSLAIGPDAQVICGGAAWTPDGQMTTATFSVFGSSGALLYAARAPAASSLMLDSRGSVLAGGRETVDGADHGALTAYGLEGNIQMAFAWGKQDISVSTPYLFIDGSDNVVLAGHTTACSGVWSELSSACSPLELSTSDIQVVSTDLHGESGVALGTESAPNGVQDVGGGGGEVLVLKNFPR